jgi:hypothetical protein
MRTFFLPLLCLLLLLISACDSTPAAAKEAPPSPPAAAEFTDPVDESTYQPREVLYTWVNGLNVRKSPAATAQRVARVSPADQLIYTGTKSDKAETIVLRGVAYNDNWYEVTTPEEVTGWVFGGAVKRKDDRKGNKAITDMQFDFPAFGSFDLTKWTALTAADNAEGDVSSTIVIYEREDERLSVERIERGEYGYEENYVLMDLEKNIRKERSFSFETDPQLMLVETVIDHQPIPAIEYKRTQLLDKHFMQLNERPVMAVGAWVEAKQ